jgi:hypothetical protein
LNILKSDHKLTIENVRKVSWDTGEMCEFASCLVSALQALGEDVPYYRVMGASGAAFRFTIAPTQWEFGSYSIRNISPDAYAPIRRAFEAAGYTCTIHERGAYADDLSRIKASLESGVPVLAFGVVGPSDCSIITGYDEDGAVLMGWSTYQDIPDDHNIPHDATGYFRKPGWHANTPATILVGEKITLASQDLRALYLDSMRWAVTLMRMSGMDHWVTGLSGLQVWADEMTDEQYFPIGDEETLGQRYVSAAINMTMLRDHCLAEPYLRHIAEAVPEFQPELSQAIEHYGEVRRIRDGMDNLIGDNFSEQAMKAIAVPKIRREYAESILRIRDAEEQAVSQLEGLLRRIH